MKFRDAIEEFNNYVSVTRSKGTYDFYQYYLKSLSDALGHMDCDQINNSVILKYIQQLKRKNPAVKHATINKHIIALKASIRYVTGRKVEFSKLKEDKQTVGVISEKTLKRVFEYYQKHISDSFSFRNYLFYKLLLDTGLRLTEMANISINNIDLNTNTIHVKVTKTKNERFVCFTDSTKELLIKFIITHKIDKYLFFDFNTGKPLTTSSIECFTYRLKKKLGIKEGITPHKWRHTFATKFLRSGGNIETLRIILGHSNLKTTQIYLHLTRNDIYTQYIAVMNQN